MMAEKEIRVVLIGKNEDINEILGIMLVRRGFHAEYMSIEVKALKVIKDNNPDIIILDIERWGVDEMMICEGIRTDESIKDIPIIFCIPGHVREIVPYASDSDQYLQKPFKFDNLYRKICLILKISG
ncbi:MAG: response regulator [Candidatus Omnitrophota bacterium]|nr:hypothetical protein [Candidatus Omnitrophota bacterium]